MNGWQAATAAIVMLSWLSDQVAAKEPSGALELARQLNQAFIEVAENVSPSVVVIKVAQKSRAEALDDPENPFWDLVPKEFREQFEKEREKRRKKADEVEAKLASTVSRAERSRNQAGLGRPARPEERRVTTSAGTA